MLVFLIIWGVIISYVDRVGLVATSRSQLMWVEAFLPKASILHAHT